MCIYSDEISVLKYHKKLKTYFRKQWKEKVYHKYYIYMYLRDDMSPYYVGCGNEYRAWHKHKFGRLPKKKSNIVIITKDLTFEESIIEEQFWISFYGRIDIGTGILRNFTSGGEGMKDFEHSDETKKKLSEIQKGKRKGSDNHFFGKKHSKETKIKMSAAKTNVYGWKSSRSKRYIVLTPDNRFCIINGLNDFCRQNGLSTPSMRAVISGKQKRYKGYKCCHFNGFQDMRRILLSKEMCN